MLVARLLAGKNEFWGFWVALITVLSLMLNTILAFILYRMKVFERKSCLLFVTWFIIGLVGMGLYKQHVYDHYFGFLFSALFLIFSVALERLWSWKIIGRIIASVLLLGVTALNIVESPLKNPPGFQLKHTEKVSKKIVQESGGNPFNLGLIAKQNYDAGYRYFLEKWDKKAVEIDPQRAKETITEQLFVVCEENTCQPTSHPQAEIANFGWSKIEQEWTFDWGTKLFKLVHYSK